MSKPRPVTPTIPAWMDDAGLSAAEFRVLAKLWRHAGKNAGRDNHCYPGYKLICATCCITENTLARCLKSLESRGLLKRRKGQNHRNLYDLFTPKSVTPSFAMTEAEAVAPSNGVTDEELATHSFETASPIKGGGEKCVQEVIQPGAPSFIGPTGLRLRLRTTNPL